MPSVRSSEFAKFVTDGKRQRFGELLMVDNKVYSYDKCIAVVHRDVKEISFDATKVSATTSCHQRAVRNGFNLYLPAGWVLTETNLSHANLNNYKG